MTDTLSKRQISDVSDASSSLSKRVEKEDPKKVSKPGRKPLDTEPKNKRTAQNRAAQRAFRERKEKKMKELEDKIDVLEQETKSAQTESEFLRVQVRTLMAELAKHRGTTDISDLKLPVFSHNINKGSLSSSTNGEFSDTPGSDASSTFSPHSSESTTTLKSLSSAMGGGSATNQREKSREKTQEFAFEFPWSRKGSVQSVIVAAGTANGKGSNGTRTGSNNVPGLSSDASTSSSSESSPFELYNADESQDLPMFKKNKDNQQEFNFDENFNEGVSEFCNDLGTACGTKEAPVPKSKSTATTPIEPSAALTPDSLNNNTSNNPLRVADDPLAFLRDPTMDYNFGSFDPTLAFGNDANVNDLFDDDKMIADVDDADPLAELTTEESLYDPFGMFVQSNRGPSLQSNAKMDVIIGSGIPDSYFTLPKTSTTVDAANESDSEVVPSTEGRLLKCTEIWDRITSHPKYADIDIDGLCSELRSKAKCSDKGVVIDFSEVNKVIMNSLPKE